LKKWFGSLVDWKAHLFISLKNVLFILCVIDEVGCHGNKMLSMVIGDGVGAGVWSSLSSGNS